MGIQINGSTDTISAVDGSLSLVGGELRTVSGLNVSGVATATTFIGDLQVSTGATVSGSTNVITASTNGSERVRIDSSGNFGVGTASPGAPFDVIAARGNLVRFQESGSPYNGLVFSTDSTGATIKSNSGTGYLAFNTGNSESVRIDISGRLLVGTSSARTNINNESWSGNVVLNVEGANAYGTAVNIVNNYNGNGYSLLNFLKSNTTSVGSNTIVTSGDTVGLISFQGNDGTEFVQAAAISAVIDSTPGANDMPGRLVFSTTDDGASSPTERMRIDSSGRVVIGTTSSAVARVGILANTNAEALALISRPSDDQCELHFRNSADDATLARISTVGGQNFAVRTGSSEAFRVDSSQRLLVGTTSSAGAGCNVQIRQDGFGRHLELLRSYDSAATPARLWFSASRGSESSPSIQQNGDAVGELRFNSYDGTDYNSQVATITAHVDATPGSNDTPGRLVFSTTADGASSPTERMRITSGGTVTINRGTGIFDNLDLAKLQVYNNVASYYAAAFHNDGNNTNRNGIYIACGEDAGSGTLIQFADGNGSTLGNISFSGSSTAYNTTSDYRLKENIVPLTDGISRVNQLSVHRFNFIDHSDRTVDGFIAHEVQSVVPEAITGEKDAVDDEGNPVYQGIDQSKLVPLLTAALQEAIAKIETLETEKAEILARLDAAGI